MSEHRPRKRFGQHFLHDRGVISRIVAAIAPQPGDRIVEIGPGLGALTIPVLERVGEMWAVELDRNVIPELEKRAAPVGRLHVVQGDALAIDLTTVAGPDPVRLVGNLPYNVSTPLLFHFLAQANGIIDMTFMLQREVVDRMAAGPGDADYGRLSIMLAQRCSVEPLFRVGPGAFTPPPKVESAIVRLVPHVVPPFEVGDPILFANLVRTAFSHRRKTLRNALRSMTDVAALERAGIDPGARPETVSPEAFAALARELSHSP